MLLLAGLFSVAVEAPASSTTRRAVPPSATYTVSSFNVLGASHTPAGGARSTGATRIIWANQLLDQHGVDVVGFQEMQGSQLTKFLQITAGSWGVYPGFTLRARDTENSIGWRTDEFDLVQATTVNIPYFNGSPRAMPIVLLREKASGLMSYFTNFHNPADTAQYRNQGKWRAEATRVEVALHNQLAASGIPRFMTGDMNERAPYMCRVTAGVAARRGPRRLLEQRGLRGQQAARGRLDLRVPGPHLERLHRGPQPAGRPDHRPPDDRHGCDRRRQQGTRRAEPDAAAAGGPRRHLLRPPPAPDLTRVATDVTVVATRSGRVSPRGIFRR